MQDQLGEAIATALRSTMGTPAAAGQTTSRPAGRRFLAAMIDARDNECECGPCGLLREELDEALGDLLKGPPAHAGSANNQPSPSPANRRQRRS